MPEETELSFEAAVSQLEAIVEALEQGEPSLAAALAKYENGVQLLTRCYGLLEKAERSVAVLTGVDAEGTPTTQPFDDAATFAADSPRAGKAARPAAVPSVEPPPAPAAPASAPRPSRSRRARPVEETEPDRFDPPF